MPKFSVKKPLTIFVVVLAIIVLGVVAYLKMTPDLMPNMDFPYVILITTDPGASPESVEENITKPMEKTMATLNDIKSVTSTSQNSVSMVALEFEEGVNLDTIGVDIQQKIAVLQGEWDDMVGTPYVLKINPSMLPVMVAAISSDQMDIHALSDFVDETLGDKLTGVTGVASVDVIGTLKREAHVVLSQEKMDALSVKLEAAIGETLDDTAAQLYSARQQILDAQQAMEQGKQEAIDGLLGGGEQTVSGGWFGRLVTLRQNAEKLGKLLRGVADGSIVSGLGDTVSGALDAVTQMTTGSVQMSTALTQIDQGLKAIEEARKTLSEKADMSSILNVNTISGILTAQNFSMPAGYIQDNAGVSYMVSVGDEIMETESLRDLVLIDLGMDSLEPIHLGDVAEVVVTDNADEIYAKLNGQDGVIVTFNKQSNYATAEVSENVTNRFRALESEYEGLHFVPLMDQGDYIHLIVSTILSSLLWGALFSVIVLFLFLRDWRPTVITMVSIPVSVIFAVVLMYFSGVTINMISLSGLAVSVGMLVDNSVVVIENIYRLRAKGATIIQAAVSGAGQVLGAITASTLTTVCVFLPIVFVEGITKTLFTDLALTMTYSLLASLLIALTLVPAMAQGLLRGEYVQKKGILDKVYPVYRKAAEWSLDHKAVILGGALALLIASGVGAMARGYTFMPTLDMNMISASITMPEEATMEQAAAFADEVAARAMTVENVDAVGVAIGGDSMSMLSGGGGYDATMYITMPEGTSGIKAGKEIEALCADLGCEVKCDGINEMMSLMTGGTGISLSIYSDDMNDLQTAAKAIAGRIENVAGTTEVSDGLEDAAPAIHIAVDRMEAMKHGMTVAQVYMQVAAKMSTTVTGSQMVLDDQKMDLILESSEESRLTLEELEDMVLTPDTTMADAMSGAAGGMGGDMSGMSAMLGGGTAAEKPADTGTFRLGDIATVEKTVSLNSISRVDQRRCLGVSAKIADGYNVTLVTSAVQEALADIELPSGVKYEFDGENEQIMNALKQVLLMMVLGIVLVYFIMVAQFQSLMSPFIVMFTIPLAFTGGFLALLISGLEISVVSLVGFVMLVGIIVNNGIVLVDYINQQRLEGMERREAILDAGVTRMRPILMTSLTTILGLFVMALAQNVGTSLVRPIALVSIGGLLYATLMTLFVVPCMYDMFNKKELRRVNEDELKLLDE